MINAKENHTYIIGISGGSASGKSTLSKLISDKLPNSTGEIINADKYYKRDNMPQMVSPLTGESGPDWNTPEAIDIDAMYSYITSLINAKSYDYIIVEGAFIFCFEKIRKICDLTIYIDLDSDIRMYRRIKRNMAVRGLSFEEIADYYTEYAKFSEQKNTATSKIYADIVLNGNNFQYKALDILILYIESQING
jgi:uridine kinase